MFYFELFIFIFVFAPFSILLHECGHAFAAKILNANEVEIVLGNGNKHWSIKLFGITFKIRSLFFSLFYTRSFRDNVFSNKEKVYIAFAGPVMNGLVACFMSIIYYFLNTEIMLQLAISFNLWLAIINCIPFKIGQKQSDGYTIYKLIKK